MKVGNITKADIFKGFLLPSYKKTNNHFFVVVHFNIFMKQTIIDNFDGLRKNMSIAFPLKYFTS